VGEYDDFKPTDDLGGSGDNLGKSLGNLDHLGYSEDFGALGLGYPGDLGPAYPGGWRDEPSMAGEHAFGWKWLEGEWKDMRSWWKRLLNIPGPAAVPSSTQVQAAAPAPAAKIGWDWPWQDRREERPRLHHRRHEVLPPTAQVGAPPVAGAVWVPGHGWMIPADQVDQ
jgi:hypothetical protein